MNHRIKTVQIIHAPQEMADPDIIKINLDIKDADELKQVASKDYVILLKDTNVYNP